MLLSEAIRKGSKLKKRLNSLNLGIETDYFYLEDEENKCSCVLGAVYDCIVYDPVFENTYNRYDDDGYRIQEYVVHSVFAGVFPELSSKFFSTFEIFSMLEKYEDLPNYNECIQLVLKHADHKKQNSQDNISFQYLLVLLNDTLDLSREVISDIVENLGY